MRQRLPQLFAIAAASVDERFRSLRHKASLRRKPKTVIMRAWYSLFSVANPRRCQNYPGAGAHHAGYRSCSGYLPGECWGRVHTSIKVVGNFARSVPDAGFEIREVLVAGESACIVRGEGHRHTRRRAIWRVPYTRQELQDHDHRYSDHQGRPDCQDLPRHGKLAPGALGQLRAKQ